MKKQHMKNNIVKYMLVGSMLFGACTDLEVDETDSIIIEEEGEFAGVNAASTLTTGYNEIAQSSQENVYALSVATTDELFIPTRGTDWGDNGVWRDLAKHGWTSAHLFNNNTWNYLNRNVYRMNQVLHPTSTEGKTPLVEAEAKFIRAYNMFWILDFWRQIPFRDADEGPDVTPSVMTGQAAFDFIVKDLEEALAVLPATAAGTIASQNRASKAAANYMLAKLYLNKHIYLGTAVNSADMDKVIAYVDAITANGYALQNGYFGIFAPTSDSETILWSNAQYASRIWGSLHYNQGRETDWTSGGWNGFATTADFYNLFQGPATNNAPGAGQEERRGYVPNNALGIGFLIGTQYDPNGVILARSGQPLSYTLDVPSLTGNPDYTGVRLLKYHPTINMPGTWGNHLLLMRYADAFLMKAEALFRKGGAGTTTALNMINQLRTLRSASTLATITEQTILDERGRELYMEGWRRNDLVRFGQFNSQFGFVENVEEGREVFPIPDNALGSNPNLKQNPGY
jgi:starch-binding outer membrane protein, SusD/RagB family